MTRSRTQSSLGILDRLTALVDKSLVEIDRTTGLRYRLLESVRQYAGAKLLARGEAVEAATRAAHRDHYLDLAETAAPHLIGHGQLEWLDRLGLELDNLRAALAYSLDDPDPAPGLRLSCALCYFWTFREPTAEGATALIKALDRDDAQAPLLLRGRALVALAVLLANLIGEPEAAIARGEEALAIARQLPDERLYAQALDALALAHLHGGREGACLEIAEEGLAAAEMLMDPHLTARLLMCKASSPGLTYDERLSALKRCRAILKEAGDVVLYVRNVSNLGYLELEAGRLPAAREHLSEAVGRAREMEDRRGLTIYTCNLGFACYLDGDDSEARALFDESLRIARRNGDLLMVAYTQLGFALLSARSGDSHASAELHGTADAIHERLGTRVQGMESRLRNADIARLRADLGEPGFEAAYRAGRDSLETRSRLSV